MISFRLPALRYARTLAGAAERGALDTFPGNARWFCLLLPRHPGRRDPLCMAPSSITGTAGAGISGGGRKGGGGGGRVGGGGGRWGGGRGWPPRARPPPPPQLIFESNPPPLVCAECSWS